MTNCPASSGPERLEFGQTEDVPASCDQHGPYTAKRMPTLFGAKPVQTLCPACVEARRQRDQAAAAEREQREQRARIDALFARSGIPARFADRTLDGYKAATDGQRRALRVAERFVETFAAGETPGVSLVLAGKPGTGKTHLACGIGHALIRQHGATVLFATVLGALRSIKDTYRRESDRSESDAIRDLLRPDLLILDEVGVQLGSEHEKMLLFEVINERYQACRSTILISNLTREELTQFLGDRVMDRFRESGAVVAFDWPSYRGVSA